MEVQDKYIEYKYAYMNLRSMCKEYQIGGNKYLWLHDIWGKTKKIKYTGRYQAINKPNEKKLLIDGKKIKFSFIPEIFHNNYSDTIPIKHTIENCEKINEFFKTKVWKEFIKYCFDAINPFIMPPYSPEIYRLDDIDPKLDRLNDVIVIVIHGTIKKYDYTESYGLFRDSGCIDKKWTEKLSRDPIIYDFYEYVTEGFFKSTEEGETHIPGIGQLNMGVHTRMKFEYK